MFLTKTKKSPYYQLVIEVDGKRTTISTKTKNKKEAQKFLKEYREDSTAFKPKRETRPKPAASSITLSKFYSEYLEYIKLSKSRSYINSVRPAFNKIIEFTGDISLTQIDSRIIDKFISTTFARTKSGAALYYRTLQSAFNKAIVWKYIDENPFKNIKPPKTPKKNPLFITEQEFSKILENTEEKYLKDLFTLAFNTGMRLGEIVNLTWNQIDLEGNKITVQNTDEFSTKSKKDRIIPINKTLHSTLTNRIPKVININTDQYVFTRVRTLRLNEDFVSKKFKSAVRDAELNDKIHFHTLRHSFASRLVQKGVSLYVVKELLGHEDIKTTQIYSHLEKENLYNAVNLL